MKKCMLSLIALFLIAGCSSTPTQTPTPVATEEATPTPTAETAEVTDYVIGTWTDNLYESETIGIRFTLQDGWISQSEEYQQAILDAGSEALGQEATQETILEFLVTTKDNGVNIQGVSNYVGPIVKSLTPELLIETMKSQLTAVEEFSYEVLEEGTATVGGSEFNYLYLLETNYNLHQKVYFKVVGEYLTSITVSSDEANVEKAEEFVNSIEAY
ncbi:MAG: hypothetical protein RR643_02315 [Anaerorhabdus sp.]|uniref:hypothetical protein n=1 Tax=Anaerorhabdus sp. TaxID=1872524 RepID=UPI002FC828FC